VVGTSFHSLSEGNGGSGEPPARRGLVYQFSQRSHAEVLNSTEKSAHASRALNGSTTLLKKPCVVKVELKERYWYEFD
jgi:hypothetical protein